MAPVKDGPHSSLKQVEAPIHGTNPIVDSLFDEQGLPLDDELGIDDELLAVDTPEPMDVRRVRPRALFGGIPADELEPDWLGRPAELYNGHEGHQFVTTVGRLDFLAVDTSDNALVVIELKRARPSDQVVEQAARYMGWIKHTMAGERPVRGLIIAHEIDDKLKFAASIIDGLDLMSYEITFGLTPPVRATPLSPGRDRGHSALKAARRGFIEEALLSQFALAPFS